MFIKQYKRVALCVVVSAFVLSVSCSRQTQSNASVQGAQQLISSEPLVHVNPKLVLRFDGIGPANIGMTASELKKVLGVELTEENEGANESCVYLVSSQHPQLAFMMIDGKLSRIDVVSEGLANVEGIQVGSSISEIHKAYGKRVKVDPHAYSQGENYLTIRSKNRLYGVRFETNEGKVHSFYAEKFESIKYIEGCL